MTFSGKHLVGTTSGATTLAVTALGAKFVLTSLLGKPDTESQEKRQRLGASPREKRLPSATRLIEKVISTKWQRRNASFEANVFSIGHK